MRRPDSSATLDSLLGGETEVVGREALEAKLRAGKRLIIKHGVDATARDLHLGHAVCYHVMRRFQDAGHAVVLLIGDFTTRVGDPTGRNKTRPLLSEHEIETNIRSMIGQAGRVLDESSLTIRRNSEWFAGMGLAELLRLGTRISASRLWDRDMFRRRLERKMPVYVHEFLYPILQGYDSYMLSADVTVNGTDQYFNELMGREIQLLLGQEPQSIVLMPILQGIDGRDKMSQSLGNYIGLAESADDQYGKLLSIPDALLPDYFRLCTRVPSAELAAIVASLEGPDHDPMEAKMRLAREIVSLYHSEDAAIAAETRFIDLHCRRLTPADMRTDTIPRSQLPVRLTDVLMRVRFASSHSNAKRLIEGGGVRVDGSVISDINHTFTTAGGHVLQAGKRRFVRLRIE